MTKFKKRRSKTMRLDPKFVEFSFRFINDGVVFGWEPIERQLEREIQRKRKDELPQVPGLKESFVYRDSWTRLNVKPAKIMQVCKYITL